MYKDIAQVKFVKRKFNFYVCLFLSSFDLFCFCWVFLFICKEWGDGPKESLIN